MLCCFAGAGDVSPHSSGASCAWVIHTDAMYVLDMPVCLLICECCACYASVLCEAFCGPRILQESVGACTQARWMECRYVSWRFDR